MNGACHVASSFHLMRAIFLTLLVAIPHCFLLTDSDHSRLRRVASDASCLLDMLLDMICSALIHIGFVLHRLHT